MRIVLDMVGVGRLEDYLKFVFRGNWYLEVVIRRLLDMSSSMRIRRSKNRDDSLKRSCLLQDKMRAITNWKAHHVLHTHLCCWSGCRMETLSG